LSGPNAEYYVPLPEKGEMKQAILETYTKEHSAEYQAQALIDLARDMRKKIKDFSKIESIEIHTSHHTHNVIGTGANDPQKMDPNASRETLDHSIMYIFAVALEDGKWDHVESYSKARANKESTVALWKKIKTFEDKDWTRQYHDNDPTKKRFGGKVLIKLQDGQVIQDQLAIADAHPQGKRPFQRKNYVEKFRTLTKDFISREESERFLNIVQDLKTLKAYQLKELNIEVLEKLKNEIPKTHGIF